MQIVGYILIALGAIDFLLGNFGNINLHANRKNCETQKWNRKYFKQ